MAKRRLKGNKLSRETIPSSHSINDFKCFGPPATEDGKFEGTMLCDMGCFKQGDVDSNKYYHGAVIQSTKNDVWFAYFEFGRTSKGVSPSFQFIEGPDKETAIAEYEYQMHAKNDKRGEWVSKPGLGEVLQPKANKDCYLVRPQATRSTGLPDARTIVHGVETKKKKSTKSSSTLDPQSTKLLTDLNMATTQYTRSSMINDSIPTQDAIEKCRMVLNEATKIANKLKSEAAVLASKDLGDLTNMMYSLIPKHKHKKAGKDAWWLTPYNISDWRDDLDAFEAALQSQDHPDIQHDLPFHLEWMGHQDKLYDYVSNFMRKATKNRHYHVRDLKIKNMWKVVKGDDLSKFKRRADKIITQKPRLKEKPLHQIARSDLDSADKKVFASSGTYLLFHGTRTVNVTGIMSAGLKLPKQLSNTAINGAMYGSGIYFADDWKKSAGYCSYAGSYWAGDGGVSNRDAFMFICDVTLGDPHLASGSRAYTGPPSGKHSIAAMGGRSSVANNEFIIFNRDQQYLRYLIEFSEG